MKEDVSKDENDTRSGGENVRLISSWARGTRRSGR